MQLFGTHAKHIKECKHHSLPKGLTVHNQADDPADVRSNSVPRPADVESLITLEYSVYKQTAVAKQRLPLGFGRKILRGYIELVCDF